MLANGFFDDVGEAIGNAIHALVTFLFALFGNAFAAVDDFVDGLTRSLGISDSFFSILVLVVGLFLLLGGFRALLRGGLLGAIVQIGLGLLVLGWLMV
ncbi:hypothetical protein P1P91_14190 [Halomonas piscis]|uniref:MFS transporter n=1 Tax=Halomonas piscis TaxID=3031727 RepID=A0ABY9YZS2_9GAMM|nr:hypothetical protein [Halomonas piscis]WNK19955.1 hypothetical protein P1P91_14190 [Halomonas piscis]